MSRDGISARVDDVTRILERLAGLARGAEPSRRARVESVIGTIRRAVRPDACPFPISGPCAEVLGERKDEAGSRQLLYGESGDGRWLHVHADRGLVRWVVAELVDNVFRHAEGWSRIAIFAEPVRKGVRLTIRDDGCGFRGPAGSDRIGLPAVARVVAAQGGSLETRSTPGGGVLHLLRWPQPADGPYGPAKRPYRHPRNPTPSGG